MSSSDSESSQDTYGSLFEQTELSDFEDESSRKEGESAEWSGMPDDDDPIADEEYFAEYSRALSDREDRLRVLEDRFEQRVNVSDWCRCGHCSLAFTYNKEELSCCSEIEKCKEALADELVLAEVMPGKPLQCITDHPGFSEVCLAKWSLRVAATKFKTRGHEKYYQRETEEKFLRSISYRQFVRLVYGQIGKKRIPLPSCAYNAIRRQFDAKTGDGFTGYKDMSMSD